LGCEVTNKNFKKKTKSSYTDEWAQSTKNKKKKKKK